MEKKMTAVQWLIENAKGFHTAKSSKAMQKQALAMEREQIEEAYNKGEYYALNTPYCDEFLTSSDYYEQTFK